MTWNSTMSSGYSSLEEDSEEYFFTARTSFFKKPSGKLTDSKDVEKEREVRKEFSREEIRQRIEQYNSLTKDYLKMTLNPSGVYTGFIKVLMDLRRPVTVREAQRGAGGAKMREAFYLPRGVDNTLHISSENTVQQVITALLNKFTVADNPAKYALYKRCRRDEQVYVCKLADGEKPLFLRLLAGPDLDTLSFVLREQQTGEVMTAAGGACGLVASAPWGFCTVAAGWSLWGSTVVLALVLPGFPCSGGPRPRGGSGMPSPSLSCETFSGYLTKRSRSRRRQ